MSHIDKVREFHRAFGHPAPEKFTKLSPTRIQFRINLLVEEFCELVQAIKNKDKTEIADALCDIMYLTYGTAVESGTKPYERINFNGGFEKLFFSIAELDLDNSESYTMAVVSNILSFCYNIAEKYDIPRNEMDLCFSEVHRSNMSKLGADGKPIYREDGKIMKGENYTPPNLKSILE